MTIDMQPNINTIQVEMSILSALMMIEDTVYAKTMMSKLKAEYFQTSKTRQLFELIKVMNLGLKSLDAISISTQSQIWDLESLIELQGRCVTTTLLEGYIETLKEAYVKNQTRSKAYAFVETILNSDDASKSLEEYASSIKALQSELKPFVKLTQTQLLENTELQVNTGSVLQQVSLGLPKITDNVHLYRGQTMVIGSDSGLGKTAFSLSCMQYQYLQGINTVYFCCESKSEELLQRMCCQSATSSYVNMTKGFPYGGKDHFLRALDAYKKFPERMSIYGKDNYKNTIEAIDRELYEISLKTRLDCVYIDYFQALRCEDKIISRQKQYEQYEFLIYAISDLAVKYNCLIVAISQLNRDREVGERPTIMNLRGASAIENVAHCIAFLYQEPEVKKDTSVRVKETFFYSGKTRLIAPFNLSLKYDSYCGMFHDKMEAVPYPYKPKTKQENDDIYES